MRQNFLWAQANYKATLLKQKAKNSDLFLGKSIYVIKKVIKNYIQHIIMVTLIFTLSYERLKPYFKTSAQEISAI